MIERGFFFDLDGLAGNIGFTFGPHPCHPHYVAGARVVVDRRTGAAVGLLARFPRSRSRKLSRQVATPPRQWIVAGTPCVYATLDEALSMLARRRCDATRDAEWEEGR